MPTFSVSDSISISESVTLHIVNPASSEVKASLVTSAYKWLTQKLFNTQQSQTVRPYFTVQVIDDTIQPKAQLFSGAGTPLGNGTMAVAPDGMAFAVGLDGSNNLKVFRANSLDAVAGVWPSSTTLNTAGDNFLDSRNVYSISISDYYNGKYRICVSYFANFINDGSDLTIKLQYSDDGGLTFSKLNFSPATLPNNAIGNLSLASMKPVFTSAGAMKMGIFYIKPNTASFSSGFTGYDIYLIYSNTGGGFNTDVKWTGEANSYDWTIHSLAAYYLNGKHYCVFSGFRNILDSIGINPTYSLWTTSIINLVGTNSPINDLWSAPIPVMPIGSASSTNQNQFLYPAATVVNNFVYLTAQAILVDSLSQTSTFQSAGNNSKIVTTHTNYVLLNSDDGEGFSYPTILVGTDGTEFNSGGIASFILQNGFWFLGGALGYLWEMTQNNIVADVSADVISFAITEIAGQPASVHVQIANQNNQWVGSAPTNPGAAAIAKNRKIAIWQGFYNSDGSTALVPHSTFYIDDINQAVSATQNDITLIGRDFYKKLSTTVTKFSYQYNGPTFFADIFDGSFISSWNQINGVWTFNPGNPPSIFLLSSTGESDMMVASNNGGSYGHLTKVFALAAGGGFAYFYGFYIDSDNYLRLELNNTDGTSWAVVIRVNGVNGTLGSGSLPFTINSDNYAVYVKRYDYFKFNFIIVETYVEANALIFSLPTRNSYLANNGGNGEYDVSSYFQGNSSLQKFFTTGFGSSSAGTGPRTFFFFSLVLLNSQNSLGIVMRKIARIAGIFSFYIKYTWRELLFMPNFTGTFTIKNRILNLGAGNQAVSNINSMANGEISFLAKCASTDNVSNAGFRFIFRKTTDAGGPASYYFHVIQATGGLNPPVFCRFERLFQTIPYVFYNSAYDVSNNPSAVGSLRIDMTKWNKYKIVMIDGWMYAFINDVMVAAWNDNNTTVNYLTDGQWGFLADPASTLQVQQISAPQLWKPIQSFGLNSGDDMLSQMTSLATSLLVWFFSDLLSRFKSIFLNANDASTYEYNTQLYQQNVDQSDKEYISQVTVYGEGVIATARNTNLMAGAIMREMVVVDYKINTEQDAQTRADNELINANQYQNQYTPKQVINVGAELFDAVTIINTGNNTSGVNSITRVYTQTFTQGGGSNNSDYSIELDTGNL